jgi:hypothetical protein
MPDPSKLTRRRSADRPDCWHIYYGDVQAGTIAMRAGNPHDTEPWEWICGFYPGSHPGEIQSGTSETFDDARAEFAGAWKIFFANRTDADFQAWRYQRDQAAWKYAMWDAGLKNADATAERPIKMLLWRRLDHQGRDRSHPVCACTHGSSLMKGLGKYAIWSMKADRELIELAKTKTLEAIADQIQRPPATILRAAKRLGLSVKCDKAKGK